MAADGVNGLSNSVRTPTTPDATAILLDESSVLVTYWEQAVPGDWDVVGDWPPVGFEAVRL